MTDPVGVVGNTALTFAVDRALGAATRAVATGAKLLLRREGDGAKDSGVRAAAYERLWSIINQLRTDLGILGGDGGVPTLRGALWTWPVHLRIFWRFNGASHAFLDAVFDVAVKGRSEVLEAAFSAADTLASAMQAFPWSAPRSRRKEARMQFQSALAAVDQAVVDYAWAVRVDLGYGPPTKTRRRGSDKSALISAESPPADGISRRH